MRPRPWHLFLIVAVWALFAVNAIAMLRGRGGEFRHFDLGLLFNEQAAFYRGQYPHEGVAATPAGMAAVRSDYPPWSFPLGVPWLPPGLGWDATRVWFSLCQLAAVGVLLWFVTRRARGEDRGLGWLLTGSVLAMTGLRADLLFGNYALIMMAMVVALLIAVERQRIGLAAAALAEAMLKPQIGWLFALTFLHRRGWKVLLGAGAALAISAALALAWTGVTPWHLLQSRYSESLTTISTLLERHSLVTVFVQLGLAPESALATAGALGIATTLWTLHARLGEADALTRFAFVGLVNRICTYHNTCDDVLLVLALVWFGRRAWRDGTVRHWAEFLALGATVWAPSALLRLPATKFVVVAAWVVFAAAICRRETRASFPLPA